MTDLSQIFLIIVVVVLSTILSIIGIQVFLILKEVQRSIQKVNKMLDDVRTIFESIVKPITALSNSITGLSGITGLFGWLADRKKRRQEEGNESE